MAFFLDSVQLGLEYALMAVGVFITFRILNIPDLTVDGSFTLGIVISSVFAVGGHPFAGLLLALLGGALAGTVTGLLHTRAHIHPILAGILTTYGLYTVNIKILGGPNLSLLNSKKFFDVITAAFPSMSRSAAQAIAIIVVCAAVVVILNLFFKTVAGLCIQATGNNEEMVRASSINTAAVKVGTFALANALVALSGGLLAQYQGFGDVSSGSGMVVIGLASVIIGEVLFGHRSILIGLISAVCGCVIYRIIIALALHYNLFSANALKLLSAVIVAATLSVPPLKGWIAGRLARRGA
ncbi:MAG: ABC-type uncharacterized transport system, permease component [Oscillospiraceae bacterium]|nr:ABC-type uncharacterized transport system, permease component [Oscillospiraceae bacterium]